ncbi:hypothetical protein [Polaromonas sp. JS666]
MSGKSWVASAAAAAMLAKTVMKNAI